MIHDDIDIILGDCMQEMRRYPDGYFDLAICDPPYGIGADNPSIKPGSVKQPNGHRLPIKQTRYIRKSWDSNIPTRGYFEELARVSKHQIIFGINYFSSVYPFGPGRIVWDKMNGENDQFGCEIAYYSGNRRTDIVHYMWNGMMQGTIASCNAREAMFQIGNKSLNEPRMHPTQKPVALYEWLLGRYAKEGWRILDTHLGSGSSAIAAYCLGMPFVGIELDQEYYSSAVERIKSFIETPKLFI